MFHECEEDFLGAVEGSSGGIGQGVRSRSPADPATLPLLDGRALKSTGQEERANCLPLCERYCPFTNTHTLACGMDGDTHTHIHPK